MKEWLAKVIMTMYDKAQTITYTAGAFGVKDSLHQGFVLSPLLFMIVMNVITRKLQEL